MYEIIKMSLIFTSNTQDDYKDTDSSGKLLSGRIGIERPSDYHNHLTSPLEVKPNSQIAVQSVKISRQQINEITDSQQMLYYFGKPLGTTLTFEETTSRPTLISLPRGTYDNVELATALQTQLNLACVSPAVKGNFRVTEYLSGGAFAGYTISASQNGTNDTDRHLTINTGLADITHAIGTTPTSDNFTLAGGVFTRTGAAGGTILDELCCGIATDYPLAMNSGANFWVDLRGASQSDGEGGRHNCSWAIGLTRPTIQLNNDNTKYRDFGTAPQGWINQKSILPHFYDYVVVLDAGDIGEGGELHIYQSSYEQDDSGNVVADSFKLHEIQYYGGAGQVASIITNASLNASTGGGVYQRLKFQIEGDEVKVFLKENFTGGGAEIALIDSSVNANASRVFKPITEHTNALYPKLCLAEGSLKMTEFKTFSVTSDTYKYPTLTGANASNMSGGTYDGGSSPYGNYVGYTKLMSAGLATRHAVVNQQPIWSKRSGVFIKPPDTTAYGQLLPTDPASTITITFEGANASSGVEFAHTLVLQDTTPQDPLSPEVGNYYSQMCNIGRVLGFQRISVLDQTDGTLTNFNKVDWTSTSVPDIKVNSAFVRISNLNHRTYNSCKNSVSKILYHIPRFTNDGRQFGDLFFEVGEKTYVDLNNTETFTLNQLQVQIVDKNERVVDDLVGDTIVVFHIKQK
jgi:hypothetical protein